MVSRFRDVICQDSEAWPKKWIEIDEDIQGKDECEIAHNTVWPSKKLNRPEIAKLVQTISKEFLDEDADNQIFMPARVATNTKRRIMLLDLYGPDVFVEALLDPIETMNQDILPRFIFSNLKIEMNSRIQSLNTIIMDSDIQVEPPHDVLLQKSRSYFRKKRLFSLNECINNRFLYNEFMKYLQSKAAAKFLLCLRMIEIFEDMFMDEYPELLNEVNDSAWVIFRYFLTFGSPYEISLPSKQKKEIMISLAKVTMHMFEELGKFSLSELNGFFKDYKETESYQNLWQLMAKEKKQTDFLSSFI